MSGGSNVSPATATVASTPAASSTSRASPISVASERTR